jgi:hypothetical protein
MDKEAEGKMEKEKPELSIEARQIRRLVKRLDLLEQSIHQRIQELEDRLLERRS